MSPVFFTSWPLFQFVIIFEFLNLKWPDLREPTDTVPPAPNVTVILWVGARESQQEWHRSSSSQDKEWHDLQKYHSIRNTDQALHHIKQHQHRFQHHVGLTVSQHQASSSRKTTLYLTELSPFLMANSMPITFHKPWHVGLCMIWNSNLFRIIHFCTRVFLPTFHKNGKNLKGAF